LKEIGKMIETLRNQLLIPRVGMRFTFTTPKGGTYEIFIVSADEATVYYQYMHSEEKTEVSTEQWQNMIKDGNTVSEVVELRL
jgi:hypothetical protein